LTSLDLKLSTPLLLSGNKRLALKVTCDEGPNCTPSVYVSGFAPVKPPNPSGPDGTPEEISLELKCPKNCSFPVPVPADRESYALTDVILQNPAGDTDTGAVTLKRDGVPLFVEGLDAFDQSDDLPISFAAPITLLAGQSLTLTVQCTGGSPCTPRALLNGVLKLPALKGG
jgi:hypothetical protein